MGQVSELLVLKTHLLLSSFQFCPLFSKGMLFFEHSAHEIVILLLRHCAMSWRYGDNVESCYILLYLLRCKIFTQSDPYCLTTALVIWLYYYLKERIPTLDGLLEVTITLLYVLLTIEYNTRFLLRTVQVFYVILLNCKVRSWMQCLSLVLCLYL